MSNDTISPVTENIEMTDQSNSVVHLTPVVKHPVTETTMREFFNDLVTTFVSMSAQARELIQLRHDIDDERQRVAAEIQAERQRLSDLISDQQRAQEEIRGLRDANTYLSRTAAENGERAQYLEIERDDWKSKHDAAVADAKITIDALTDANDREIREHDEHITRTQDTINGLNDHVSTLTARVRELEHDNAGLCRELDVARGSISEWNSRFEHIQVERDTLRSVLASVKSAFESVKV